MAKAASLPRNSLIVAKLGTGVLTDGGDQLDEALIGSIAKQVAEIVAAQSQVIIVTSAAVALGRSIVGLRGKGRGVTTLQALAAIGQHHLMRSYEGAFAEHGLVVAQALITRSDLTVGRSAANIRRTLRELLSLGVIPIVNENDVVASEELSETLGDNDNLSAALTNLMAADMLILLTDQDGLYDSDPRTNADAALIHKVDRVTDAIQAMAAEMPGEQGRGGMASKVRAAAEATSWGTTVVIANGHAPDVLLRSARRGDWHAIRGVGAKASLCPAALAGPALCARAGRCGRGRGAGIAWRLVQPAGRRRARGAWRVHNGRHR